MSAGADRAMFGSGSPRVTGSNLPAAASSWPNATVLVAEDNPVNIEIVQVYLDELGCKVEVAETGDQAVRLFQSRRFDAILMDCQMPEMDGFTATGLIRGHEQRSNLPRVPIIAVTANASDDDRSRCLAAGMDDYLSKPYSDTQLTAVMSRWLSRSRPAAGMPAVGPRDAGTSAAQGLEAPGWQSGAGFRPSMSSAVDHAGPFVQPEGVRALVRDFGLEIAKELISIFVQECTKNQNELASARADADKAGLQRVAHRVAGGASMICAAGLAKLARRVELSCSQREGFCEPDCAGLQDAIHAVVLVFDTLNSPASIEQYISLCEPRTAHE
jgi:two-component system, sensor histidine kinase and response regulator